MFGRTMLALVLALAVFVAPAAPIEIAKVVSPKKSCCTHQQVNVDPCHGCPMTPNSSSSSSASACCSVQAPCFVAYSHGTDGFLMGIKEIGFATSANNAVSSRSQRPPVPPPRAELS